MPALHGVRGIAVAMVVVHNAAALATHGTVGPFARLAAVGDFGVAIFFVLSGVVIYRPVAAAHLGGGEPRARQFWWRRFIRVMPVYLAVLATLIVTGAIHLNGGRDLLAHATLTNVLRPESLLSGITQGWSLTAELCFYLLIPWWSAAVRRLARRAGIVDRTRTLRIELGAIASMVVAAHAWRIAVYVLEPVYRHDAVYGDVPLRGISYLWFPSHADVFAAGMALAVLSIYRVGPFRRDAGPRAVWLGAAAALAAFVAYAYGVGSPSVTNGYSLWRLEVRQVVSTMVAVALIGPLITAGRSNGLARGLSGRVARGSGHLSYGLYLWHFDLIKQAAQRGHAHFAALALVGFVGGGAAAAITWFGVERPAQALRPLVDRAGRLRWSAVSPRARTGTELAALALVIAAPVAGLMRYQGPPMEEGFMLAFPEQLLHGRVPHVDFLHLYGPGSLWVLAAVYRVVGASLQAERLVGLVQHVVVVVALWSLLRAWGRRVGVLAGIVACLLIISPLGLSALAWNGALALALASLAVGMQVAPRLERSSAPAEAADGGSNPLVRRVGSRADRRALAISGVLAGAALLYRPDLVLAIGAALAVFLTTMVPRGARRPVIVAAVATTSLMAVHLAISGIGPSVQGMFIEPVFRLRGGRSLPIPPSWGEVDGFLQRAGALRVLGWPLPMPALSHQIAMWFWLVPISALGSAAVAWWPKRPMTPSLRRLRVLTTFGVALQSQAFQRPDTAHLAWVTVVTFPLVIAAIAEVVQQRRPRWPPAARAWLAATPILVVLVAVIPFYPLRTYGDLVGQSAGLQRFGAPIRRDHRVFYYGDAQAALDAQRVASRLSELSTPGEHLIVGPEPLVRTPYSDAFLYWLFPELVPGTRYIEMDPQLADARDSGLAEELARSDWLILSTTWSGWDEPNDSTKDGSSAPDRVVRDRYCEVLASGKFRLLRRCR